MAGILSLLAGGARAGLAADTGRMQGEREGLLAKMRRDEMANESARRGLLDQLNAQNIQSQIADRATDNARLAIPDPESFGNPFEAVGPDGKPVFVERGNRGTMRPVEGFRPPPKQAPTPAAGSFVQFTGPDGKPAFFNPQTGGVTKPPEGFTPPSTRAGLPTVEERKAAAFYKAGKFGYDSLERIIGGDDPRTADKVETWDNPDTPKVEKGKGVPGFMASTLQRIGMGAGNLMTNDQVRQMRQSGLMLSDAWLRYTSGAAVPEQEVGRFAESFLPRAGDDEGTLALKAEARSVIINAIRDGAGRALDRADDPQFATALEKVRAIDPEAAALMVRLRTNAGTQPTAADGLDAQIDAVLRQP